MGGGATGRLDRAHPAAHPLGPLPALPCLPALLPRLPSCVCSQSGGVMNFGIACLPDGGTNMTAAVFARWLSVIYIALVLLGEPHPGGWV